MRYERIPDTLPVLSGEGLTLRELTEADLPAWFGRRTDMEAAALAGDPIATSMQDIVDSLEFHRGAFRAREGLRWAIVPDELGESVGTIGFATFDQTDLSAQIGYAIGRAHWNRGITTCAARLTIDYGFNVLGLERIDAMVLTVNGASIRVLEKLGFELDGLRPASSVADKTPSAYALYSLERSLRHGEMLKA